MRIGDKNDETGLEKNVNRCGSKMVLEEKLLTFFFAPNLFRFWVVFLVHGNWHAANVVEQNLYRLCLT